MSAPIGKKVTFDIPEQQPQTTTPQISLEKTAAKLITSDQKTVTSSSAPTSSGDGKMRLTRFLQNAGAIRTEISARTGILDSLKTPLGTLQNKRMKLRGGVGEELTAKRRSFISFKSKIGGAESKDAVKNVLTQLEAASKLPNDPNNPQSILKHLDELLDNEWFSKTIAHDKSGELKSQLLDVLANEIIINPRGKPDGILQKLNPKTPMDEKISELHKKLAQIDERKEAVINLMTALEKKLNLKTFNEVLANAWIVNIVSQDSARELQKPILNILSTFVNNNYPISGKEITSILTTLNPTQPEEIANEFKKKLMDHAYESAKLANCEKSPAFLLKSIDVPTKFGTEDVQESFITGYKSLLETIRQNINGNTPVVSPAPDDLKEASPFKTIFGAQYAESHEEAVKGLETHHYMIEKSGDKIIYHFDLIGSDGTRVIRSKELTDSEAMNDPALLKSKLDAFISKLDKNKLPPK